ncbi:hypothetical protein D5125_00680 [Magnetovirga frankeli]|uniref:HEPN domain-containing protein n=1 Tax=Magnetovirga frankeli TaxID=947516 RepID=UPI0012936FE0|nr:hypothetical protein D5125_00680 [gamma proteobacterium SS-5]
MDHATLKQRHREEREAYPPALALRTHRALSWLYRAEQESEDKDARFIFLWIAFNAAYANELHEPGMLSEKGRFDHFIELLIQRDQHKLLHNCLWQAFPSSVRALIDNHYVFQPFWDHHNGKSMGDWQAAFATSKAAALRALGNSDTAKVLMIVMTRLYTLRNQLIHGGATWNSQVNRNQVRDGANLLQQLVPAMISVMMDNPGQLWGDACYPVVE